MDEAILLALRAGEVRSIDLIWDAYAERLLAFAQARLCSHHDAEEALQNVFVKIARHRDQLACARSLSAYLFTMVRNETTSLLRRRRDIQVDPRDLWLVPAATPHQPSVEEAEAVRLLSGLSMEQREVIILKFYQRMTFEEIGVALAIPPNTAASRYRYGIAALRNMMGGVGT